MNDDTRDYFKASGYWFLLFIVMITISCVFNIDGLIAFIGLLSLFGSVFTFIGGFVGLIKNKFKTQRNVLYKAKDSEEFIKQAKEIEQQFNEQIQKEQLIQEMNDKNKNNLQLTLEGKQNLKKEYDDCINSFIKENVFKVGRVTINMINGTFEYYSTIVNLEDIVDIQIKCNSQIIVKSNTSEQRQARRGLVSTVGRATVGTLAFGGAGAVLGLTGKKKTKGSSSTTTTQTQIDEYSVIVLTNNIRNSVITIPCGRSEEEALRVSNSINNASINVGVLDTEEHEVKVLESNKYGLEIKELQNQIKEINNSNKESIKRVNKLTTERNGQIKQLRKQFKNK